MRKFILIKKKGAKHYLGAIPVRKNVTLSTLRTMLKNQLKKGFYAKIISGTQLKQLILKGKKRTSKLKARKTVKRKTTKRKVTRKKTTRRKKRR